MKHYTITRTSDVNADTAIFEVLVDDQAGLQEFAADYPNASPGTTVTIVDEDGIDTKMEKRHDGEYVELQNEDESIMAKHLTVTENGIYEARKGYAYNPVTVNVPKTAGAREKDVNFYDYDGTVVYAYTAAEFAEISAMPENPSHEGLTAQGWNWSLADAKAYVAKYEKLDIGQMYITDDGKTRIKIHLEEPRLSPRLNFYLTGSVDLDWGDGSPIETIETASRNRQFRDHTYANGGDYTITMAALNASTKVDLDGYPIMSSDTGYGDTAYKCRVKEVYLGGSITIGQSPFNMAKSLTIITIPKGVTLVGISAFTSSGLKFVTLPDGMTNIKGGAFGICKSLAHICIPNSVTSIENSAFMSDTNLAFVAIPEGVTAITPNMLSECSSLRGISIPEGISHIYSSGFNSCGSLLSIAIPKEVTRIADAAFKFCHGFSHITIPEKVTSIEANAFNCGGLGSLKFKPTTPPEASANAFALPVDCKILVPAGTLEAYKAAANYPDPNSHTYEEYTE